MSKRYYYTNAIIALYMMKEFGVEFYTKGFLDVESNFLEKELGFHLEIRTLYNKLCENGSKIYVAKESEHVFEPKVNDLAHYDLNGGSGVYQFTNKPIRWAEGVTNIQIIRRDNKQFFMPEVEK